MKRERMSSFKHLLRRSLPLLLVGGTLGLNTVAAQFTAAQQSAGQQNSTQVRLARARALAASNNLSAAVKEIEDLRRTSTDEALRNGTGLMLLTLYFEQANYNGAASLLDEAFTTRNKNADAYFALAGQALRGVRVRLERYRTFSLNVTAYDLPGEAVGDLNGVRGVLDRLAEHATTFGNESRNSFEARLLLEDVAGLQLGLARNTAEKTRWTGILASTRQRMVESDSRNKANEIVRREEIAAANSGTLARNNPPNATPERQAPPVAANSGASMRPVSVPQPEETAPANPRPTRVERPAAPPQPQPTRPTPPERRPVVATAMPTPVPQPEATPADPAPSVSRPTLAPDRMIDVGPLMARAAQRLNPTYPPMARNARVTGTVKVFLEVDENGNILKVKGSEGPALLQRAAEDAARRWKFNQTVVDGQAVRVSGYLAFNFVL